MAKTTTKAPAFQNNPFTIAVDGLSLLFSKAKSVAILLVVIASLSFLANAVSTTFDTLTRLSAGETQPAPLQEEPLFEPNQALTPEQMSMLFVILAIVAVVVLGLIVISVLLQGVADYTSAGLAAGRTVSLGEAFGGVLKRFFPYLWLQILVAVKIFLWSLLLIVPGVIMAVRYSLSGVTFFARTVGANAATKQSSQLVKGGWLTTFGAHGLFNIITLGLIAPILQPGTSSILYRQFSELEKAKKEKPPAHWLSWLTLGLLVAYVLFIIFLVIVLVAVATLFPISPEGVPPATPLHPVSTV